MDTITFCQFKHRHPDEAVAVVIPTEGPYKGMPLCAKHAKGAGVK